MTCRLQAVHLIESRVGQANRNWIIYWVACHELFCVNLVFALYYSLALRRNIGYSVMLLHIAVCQFLRAIAECFARLTHGLGVSPSVRPLRPSTVSKWRHVESRNLYCGCPKDSSLSWQSFVSLGGGVPLKWGRQKGYPLKTLFCRY